MGNLKKIISYLASAAVIGSSLAFPAQAATTAGTAAGASVTVSNWTVTTAAVDRDGWSVESYKVDRDLVAWTEVNAALKRRQLKAFDGLTARVLATVPFEDWADADVANFVDPVTGSYDAADGLVVWLQRDGSKTDDREVFAFDGAKTYQVSDNSYDDRHPVTSRGRVAWTSSPDGRAYNLMLRDVGGTRRLDSWHVLNYAFSGPSLYWLNQRAGENWFRVFRNTGSRTVAVGKGDDRPLRDYFLADGQGGMAWEYSTKQWAYDKREVFVSDKNLVEARRVFQRDVPPNVTRLEAVKSGRVLVNNTDLLTTLLNKSSLVRTDGNNDKYMAREYVPVKARFTDAGVVRHLVPENSSALVVVNDAGGQDYVSLDHVILDRFDTDGNTVIGALLKGGVELRAAGHTVQIPSPLTAASVKIKNGTAAWVEGTNGTTILKVASSRVLVHITGDGVKTVSGRLVKAAADANVYLAADDGKRYIIPSEEVFRTWYVDFSSVRPIAKSDLAAMPLAGNLVFKPGTLVKAASSSRVLLAGTDGALHRVTDVSVLDTMLGKNWSDRVTFAADQIVGSYRNGQDITDIAGYTTAMKE